MYNLLVYTRPIENEAFVGNWTDVAKKLKLVSKVIGGWYSGKFILDEHELTRAELWDIYYNYLGYRCVMRSYGQDAWDGIFYELSLVVDGVEYRRSLTPDWWHNKVKVYYQYPSSSDSEQGNLAYDPGGNDAFQDDGQDFSDWESADGSNVDSEQGNLDYNPGGAIAFEDDAQDFSVWETTSGNAAYLIIVTNSDGTKAWGFLGKAYTTQRIYVYREVEMTTNGWSGDMNGKTPSSYVVRSVSQAEYSISVINSDGTTAWGFLGEAFTTTNLDDSVDVYQQVEKVIAGWNGDASGKTPSSYEVRNVELAGSRQATEWSTNDDSAAIYGTMEALVTLPAANPEAAEMLRDRELAAFAWPRSRTAGAARRGRVAPATLEVTLAGFWATLNWRHYASTRTSKASDLVEVLANASEFISVGRVESNDLPVRIDGEPPPRLGDAIEDIAAQGDLYQAIWQCGVYEERKLVYESMPTAVQGYVSEDGILTDLAGVPLTPSLTKPGFLVSSRGGLRSEQPPGISEEWHRPEVGYIEEVAFVAPDTLEYRLRDEELSISTLLSQIRGGSYLGIERTIGIGEWGPGGGIQSRITGGW